MSGLADQKRLFQPEWLCYSVIWKVCSKTSQELHEIYKYTIIEHLPQNSFVWKPKLIYLPCILSEKSLLPASSLVYGFAFCSFSFLIQEGNVRVSGLRWQCIFLFQGMPRCSNTMVFSPCCSDTCLFIYKRKNPQPQDKSFAHCSAEPCCWKAKPKNDLIHLNLFWKWVGFRRYGQDFT